MSIQAKKKIASKRWLVRVYQTTLRYEDDNIKVHVNYVLVTLVITVIIVSGGPFC
jgi:hypothetical protein